MEAVSTSSSIGSISIGCSTFISLDRVVISRDKRDPAPTSGLLMDGDIDSLDGDFLKVFLGANHTGCPPTGAESLLVLYS